MATTTETDKLLLIYESNVDVMLKEQQAFQNEIKQTDDAVKQSGKTIENSFKSAGVAADSLKTQYRKLKEQLANATDPKDIERLAIATGKVKDQLDDATDAAKVFASESKFEQVGNALGSIAGKLRNLDFKGAADQSKLLLSVIKSITFKEAIGGIKEFGVTMVNIGKSLLTNPIFLIGATIAAVGFAVYDLSQSFNKLGVESKLTTESLKESNEQLLIYADRARLANIAIQENIGAISKGQAELLRNEIKNNKDIADLKAKYSADILALARELNLDLTKTEKGYFDENYRLNYDDLVNRKNFNEQKLKLETAFKTKLRVLRATQRTEDAADSIKESADEIKKINAINQAKLDAQKKLMGDVAFDTDAAFLDSVRRQAAGEFDIKEDNREKNAEADKLAKEEAEQRTKDFYDFEKKQAQDAADLKKKLDDEEKARAKAELDAKIKLAKDVVAGVAEVYNRQTEERLQQLQDAADSENESLKYKLEQGRITEEQYNQKKKENDKALKKESDEIKRKQFEVNKQVSVLEATIAGAVAVVNALKTSRALAVLTAAAVAVQIALIESQKAPKFAKGVVGFKGKGTGTSDSNPAWISNKESIITAAGTERNMPLLKAINAGTEIKYIKEVYIAPALVKHIRKFEEQKNKSFAQNIANSSMFNYQFKDGRLLDSMKQSRKNDKEIGRYIAEAIKSSIPNYNARKN